MASSGLKKLPYLPEQPYDTTTNQYRYRIVKGTFTLFFNDKKS